MGNDNPFEIWFIAGHFHNTWNLNLSHFERCKKGKYESLGLSKIVGFGRCFADLSGFDRIQKEVDL